MMMVVRDDPGCDVVRPVFSSLLRIKRALTLARKGMLGCKRGSQFQPSEFSAMTGWEMSRPLEPPVLSLPLEVRPLFP